jgi:DNA-binding NarL/FixJ family response regulator
MTSKTENFKRKKLLIVDDSKDIREGLKRLISEFDTIEIVGEARDGISALAMVEELKPDFVTLDIKMGGDSGIIALMEMKKRFPNMIVLMLTNFSYEHFRRVCSNAGADYFFDKSLDFEEMVNIIKKLAEDSQVSENV